jgi:hypothetical protein
VPDHSERLERPGRQSGLLPELPTGGHGRGFARLDVSPRQFPEATEQSVGWTAAHEPAGAGAERHDGCDHVGAPRSRRSSWDRARIGKLAPRQAERRDGAVRTVGGPREAHGLPELHHGLVEGPWTLSRELELKPLPEPGADPGRPNVPGLERPARDDPEPVRLERDDRLVEREAGDGGGDVRPDARQLGELGRRARQLRPVIPDELYRGLVEMAGAGVVPRPLPLLQHALLVRRRERPHVGESAHERLEPGDDGRNASLLQEDLGDPDLVRIAVGPPGEWSSALVEPFEEGPGERRARGPPGGQRRPHGASERNEPLKRASV